MQPTWGKARALPCLESFRKFAQTIQHPREGRSQGAVSARTGVRVTAGGGGRPRSTGRRLVWAGRQGGGPPQRGVGSTVREGGVFCFPGSGRWLCLGFFMGEQGALNQRPRGRVCELSHLLTERRKLLEVCPAGAGWAPHSTPCPGQSVARRHQPGPKKGTRDGAFGPGAKCKRRAPASRLTEDLKVVRAEWLS